MTDFDPYLKWLGIRDSNRPPNHYRLLGLDQFESDSDVISVAADRQMAHIRTFQIGQNGETSQRILNELAEARRCLLDETRREEYNKSLQKLEAELPIAIPTQSVPVAQPDPTWADEPSSSAIVTKSESPRIRDSNQGRRKSRAVFGALTQVAAIAGGGLAAVAVSVWLIQSGLLHKLVGQESTQNVEPTASLNSNDEPNAIHEAKSNSENNSPSIQKTKPDPVKRKTAKSRKKPGKNSRKNIANPTKPPVSAKKKLPWNEPRWPSLPDELAAPVEELDRILQRTRIAIALRKFEEAQRQWQQVKLQARGLDSELDLIRQIQESKRFWYSIQTAALNLSPGDELVFRDQLIIVSAKNKKGVFVALKDRPNEKKFFETGMKVLDRDFAMALARMQEPYDRAAVDRLIAFDFTHEKAQLTRLGNIAFAGMEASEKESESDSPANKEMVNPNVRKPIPSSAEILEARRVVKRLFEESYRRSASPQKRFEAAQKMIERAATVDDNVPANKFVLLSEAASRAASFGEAKPGLAALNQLDKEFNVDFWDLVTTLMNNTKKNLSTAKQAEEAASIFRQLAIRALDEREYKRANELATSSITVADNVGDLTLYNISVELKEETKEIVRMDSRAEKARKDLTTNSSNQKANEDLGNYLCLVENDFEEGLKHWAKSGKKLLVAVAELEQQFNKKTVSNAELGIAEAWHEIGKSKKTYKDLRCLARASYWYSRVNNNGIPEISAQIRELDSLLERIPSTVVRQENDDYLNSFWSTDWRFGSEFTARFSQAGTVRISSKGRNRTLSWVQNDDEFRVAFAVDKSTFVFRPRTSGKTVAFEKIDNGTGAVLLSGVGYPRNN